MKLNSCRENKRWPSRFVLSAGLLLFALLPIRSTYAATITVTTTNDAGAGSLRQAIIDANTNTDVDTISFNVTAPAAGVRTIRLATALPAITNAVVIDGYTQTGSGPNTLTNGNNAVLLIELNGTNVTNGAGLLLEGGSNTVRGLVINRFGDSAILISTNGGNVIEGNFIGTDATGTSARGNLGSGVDIESSPNNTLGGTNVAALNLISGNASMGVVIAGSNSTNNQVVGNFIGTDVTGTNAVGNVAGGVEISGGINNIIGGTNALTRNIISGNDSVGISIVSTGRSQVVQGNFIGTDATSSNNLGNAGAGVLIQDSFGNTIGGTNAAAGNIIAFNGSNGVSVVGNSSTNNAILGNSIFINAELGIDLNVDGVTTNEGCDVDIGPNHLQNFPVLTLASNIVGGVLIQGVLNSVSNATFRLEFFANAECDPSGYGQGDLLIGFTNVTTGVNCTTNFTVTFTTIAPVCGFLNATATDTNSNNTSEFSACLPITADDACETPPSGLIHWYPGDTDGRDLAGANPGTLESGVTVTNAGKVAGAFRFDANRGGGVNLGDVADLDFTATNSFTIEAWINYFGASAPTNDSQVIVALNNSCGTNTIQLLALDNTSTNFGRAYFEVRGTNNAGGRVSSLTGLSSNQFHHIVGVREVVGSDKALKLYVDGVLVATNSDLSTSSLALNANDLIGRRSACGSTNVFNGVIDEVEIYNRALTGAEIRDIYCAGNTGQCRPADLSVSKIASPDPIGVGSNLTYTVTVTNRGPANATSVVLTDSLPTSVTFVSASSGCGEVAGVVTCNLDTLNSGAQTNVTIVVTPSAAGAITNIAVVTSAVSDLVTNNNTAIALTTVNLSAGADLAISKIASPDPVGIGSNLTYTVTVTNRGPDTATSVFLVDGLPESANFVSGSSGALDLDGLVICNLGTLNSGAKTNVTIVVRTTISGLITNIAAVTSAASDVVTNNNLAIVVTTVSPAGQNADLVVSKTASPHSLGVGSNLTYTVTVTNRGPDTATSVFLVDTLAEGVNFVSASSGCGELAGVVTCNLGTLNNGSKTNVTVVVTTTTSGLITNTANVISDINDPNLDNNIAVQVTSVSSTGACSGIDLTGVFTNVVATCKKGSGKVKGKISVQNLGTQDASTSFIRFFLSDDDQFDNPALGSGDTFLKQIATGTVKPGKPMSKTLSASKRDGCFTGKFIIAVLDADHTVAECNEDNNVIVFGPLP